LNLSKNLTVTKSKTDGSFPSALMRWKS